MILFLSPCISYKYPKLDPLKFFLFDFYLFPINIINFLFFNWWKLKGAPGKFPLFLQVSLLLFFALLFWRPYLVWRVLCFDIINIQLYGGLFNMSWLVQLLSLILLLCWSYVVICQTTVWFCCPHNTCPAFLFSSTSNFMIQPFLVETFKNWILLDKILLVAVVHRSMRFINICSSFVVKYDEGSLEWLALEDNWFFYLNICTSTLN